MSLLASAALATLAKGALTAVIGPFVEEARDAAVNAAQDAIRSKVAGKMSVEEWAGIIIEGVDTVKDRALSDGNLRYIGGGLNFVLLEGKEDLITVSFRLFFLDDNEKWQKAEASYDMPVSLFAQESVSELKAQGSIKYAVE